MSSFWLPSPRTCGGSHRWLRDRHPLGLSVLRKRNSCVESVRVEGPNPVARSQMAERHHRSQPTFATKSALLRHADRPGDVRFRGKTGSSLPTTKVTRLTPLRHWHHTTKILSIPVSALSKRSLSPLRCRLLSFGGGHAAPWFHYNTRRRCMSDPKTQETAS